MRSAAVPDRDPIGWCALLSVGFWALCLVRLTTPSTFYFDEVHYLPAAREYLALGSFTNREHPPLGKQMIALGIYLFGDNAFGWRILPSLMGGLALFAGMRALWFASQSRFATVAYGILLATGFYLFVNARIAMLDIFMVGFAALAFWQFAAAIREPESARARLAVGGIFLGLSMASKWNVLPLAMLPGTAFLIARAMAGRRRLFMSRRGAPVPGITLLEATLWLGVVPLAVYAFTFTPAWFFAHGALDTPGEPSGLIALHQKALALQESVVKSHPYQSRWPQWVLNTRSIWYLYEPVDGAQRGVLLIGNPLTMLLGIPALVWAAREGVVRRNWAALACILIYAVSLGFWILANKPVQFLYHYFLPSMGMLAALALALDAIRRSGRQWLALAPLVLATLLFVYFYPILSAAPLSGNQAFVQWMWLDRWR